MSNNLQTYKTPFSKAYWRDAAKQLTDVRMLCIAAVLIAVRVALKSIQIPVGPDLNITVGFFVNALGASVFGPLVAIVAAAISDTLGCILFPTGTYFFPFIFVEIAGSVIFALFLWRSKLSATRIILSRFCVSAVCNFIMNPTIMIWYYAWLNNGKSYAFLTVPRVIKNLALFPAEAFLLVVFLGAMLPALTKLSMIPKTENKPKLGKVHIFLLAVLALFSVGIVVGYYSLYYPTQPKSVSVTEGPFKLTLKSDRGTYKRDDMDPTAPLGLTATLKNNGETDIEAVHDFDLCDIALVLPDGTVMERQKTSEMENTTVVGAGKSVKTYESFDWVYSELGGLLKGDYKVTATVEMTVDTTEYNILVELPVKIS